MSNSSRKNQELFDLLLTEYQNLRWYSRLFYPSKLKEAFSEYEINSDPDSPLPIDLICQAFLDGFLKFQYWLFSAIQRFNTSEFAKALNYFHAENLDEKRDVLIGFQDSEQLVHALSKIEHQQRETILELDNVNEMVAVILEADSNMLKNNWNELIQLEAPRVVFMILQTLEQINLSELSASVLSHCSPVNALNGLCILKEARSLNDKFTELVLKEKDSSTVARTLVLLQKANLSITLDEQIKNYESLRAYPNPDLICQILEKLVKKDVFIANAKQNFEILLTFQNITLKSLDETLDHLSGAQVDCSALLGHLVPRKTPLVFKVLRNTQVLMGPDAQANFDCLIKHPDPYALYLSFRNEKTQILLSSVHFQDYFINILQHKNPTTLNEALIFLYDNKLLTKNREIIDLVSKHDNPVLIARLLYQLDSKTSLLKTENAKANREAIAVCKAPKITSLTTALIMLNQVNFNLNQTYFERLLAHEEPSTLAETFINKMEKISEPNRIAIFRY